MSKPTKSTRRLNRQAQKRQQQLKSIGVLMVGLLILLGAILALNYAGKQAIVLDTPALRVHPQPDNNAMGDPNAPVTVEVYSSFACSHCENYYKVTEDQFITDFVSTGMVYYVYKPFHNTGATASNLAYEGALCAGEQNAFWDMHDYLFTNFRAYNTSSNPMAMLDQMAADIGVNVDTFDACMANNQYIDQVTADTQNAVQNLGVTGTPTFVINGQIGVVGDEGYQALSDAVQAAFQATQGN